MSENQTPYRLLEVLSLHGFDDPTDGDRGIVVQIRRHHDGTFRYSLAPLTESDDVGLVDHENVRPTGEFVPLTRFLLPEPFQMREHVRVSPDHADVDIAGHEGVVDGAGEDGTICVWFDGPGEDCWISPHDLIRTGERDPAPVGPQPMTSLQVGIDGTVLGRTAFDVIDDLDWHL